MLLEEWLEAQDAARKARNPQRKEVLGTVAMFKRDRYRRAEARLKLMAGGAPAAPSSTASPGFDNRVLPPPLSGERPVQDAAMVGRPGVGMGGQGGGPKGEV